ncbi:uncharacterized protein TA18540 [Theileria annulata]|uniref:Uncharacterized protein n=1 Tax=Theileria annulata TaxID=5874 RepID=Q4UBI0_THEAN|nr:uncharacterized protein TA18540 [Theileria annulata]CAI75821.1 hypothetical protein TA18540 [Theileria annulata]|eukprot:XP_955297.1 hypothetical protein TA18540 [Theileria annulata]
MIIFFDFILPLLVNYAFAGSDKLTLDINVLADRSKFMAMRHQFLGLTYYSFLTLPGQEISRVVNGNRVLFESGPEDEPVNLVYCFYYRPHGWRPTFLVKSGTAFGRSVPLDDSSPEDWETRTILKAFFREIKRMYPNDDDLQQKLASISIGETEFDRNALSRVTFRVINDSNYVEPKSREGKKLTRRKQQKLEEFYPSDKKSKEVDEVSVHSIEDELESIPDILYASDSLSDSDEETVEPSSAQPAQQLEEERQQQPETIVISDSGESDVEVEESDKPSESKDYEPPAKKKKEEAETVTIELDSEEEDS